MQDRLKGILHGAGLGLLGLLSYFILHGPLIAPEYMALLGVLPMSRTPEEIGPRDLLAEPLPKHLFTMSYRGVTLDSTVLPWRSEQPTEGHARRTSSSLDHGSHRREMTYPGPWGREQRHGGRNTCVWSSWGSGHRPLHAGTLCLCSIRHLRNGHF